jgi:hypothetical protein
MKLSELFNIEICKNPISRDYAIDNPGKVPYITTTSENNGIECYVDYPPQYGGGVITVSKDGGNGDAFLQKLPFCGNEKVMVLTPKRKLSDVELFYYVSVIKYNKFIFGYGRKCSVARLGEIYIPSPNEIPSFVYEFSIRPITTSNKGQTITLDVATWKEFELGRLVSDVYKAKSYNKDDLTETEGKNNAINYITRTGENNGCELMVLMREVDVSYIEEPNAITIGDTTATCFYQAERFIAGDHMVVVRAEWLNEKVAAFILTILKMEQYKYSYGRAFLMDRIKATKLKLPIVHNDDGAPYVDETHKFSDNGYVPDWTFMENYIKSLPYGDRI